MTLGAIARRGAAAHAARGDAARARRGCRSHSRGAIHRHRYRIAIGNARAAHEHTTEGPGRRKRRNHIAVRIGRFNHAASRTARLYESKRLRTAREALRHAHSARHEHRTARNRRFTVVVECPIAVARGAIHQKRSAVDFNIAVGINTIALGIKHNFAAIDLDEAIRIACARCATLPPGAWPPRSMPPWASGA